jgi:excisionase family DNA binding protein
METGEADMPLLTVKQVAIKLGFSSQTIRDRVKNGELHGIKVGRQYRISNASLRKYLEGE